MFRDMYGIDTYHTPACPSQFYSIHIDSENQIHISAATGSTCTWDELSDNNTRPTIHIGDAREMSYDQICDAIWDTRFGMYPEIKRRKVDTEAIVGGCGGCAVKNRASMLGLIEKVASVKGVNIEY